MFDRYHVDQDRAGFFYVEDPECRKQMKLDPEKRYIVFYNGEYSIPSFIVVGEDFLDAQRITYELTVNTIKGKPYWG